MESFLSIKFPSTFFFNTNHLSRTLHFFNCYCQFIQYKWYSILNFHAKKMYVSAENFTGYNQWLSFKYFLTHLCNILQKTISRYKLATF
jgi:hypothetical protein